MKHPVSSEWGTRISEGGISEAHAGFHLIGDQVSRAVTASYFPAFMDGLIGWIVPWRWSKKASRNLLAADDSYPYSQV